jgi:hypothetical protein
LRSFFSSRTVFPSLSLSCALFLAGCSAAIRFPDVVIDEQVPGPAVQGTVYGGHAPIVGAHVYLLQPGTGGIGSQASSILGNTGVTSTGGYTISTNPASNGDTNVPAGFKYVTTDSTGGFGLSGAYTCAAGEPVYIYSYGGIVSTSTATSPGPYSVSQIQTGKGATGRSTFTFTVTSPDLLYAGESIIISGLTGTTSALNGTQVVVDDANLTTTTFDVTVPGLNLGNNKTYTTTDFGTGATITAGSQPINPIVLLATLGNCPTSGNLNFGSQSTSPINYIYLNEISTVATAYTFQPFTSSANNDAVHIGSSGTTQGFLGIENAANTAAQLYSIQGSVMSTVPDGEGHIANYQTQLNGVPNQGNGVVPQATIDTLGNILAACVDSTSNITNSDGALSAQCSTLFANATDNGLTTGTQPTDTATAAINIARYPGGNNSSTTGGTPISVASLYGIPTGAVPFTPRLNNAPPNFLIAINYPMTAVSGYSTATNPLLGRAESIAIDSTGQVWITAQTNNNVVRWSPQGVQNFSHSDGYIYGYVSIDNSDNAWTGNANSTSSVEEFVNGTSGTITESTYGSGYNKAYTVVANMAGDAFFVASTAATPTNYQMFEYGPGGTTIAGSPFTISPSVISSGNVAHGSVDSSGDLWLTTETSYQIARVTAAGTKVFTPIVTAQQPEFPAIDASGNAWIAIQADSPSAIYKVAPNGSYTVLGTGNTNTTFHGNTATATGATLTATFGAAVDGNGNVWLANRAGSYGTPSGLTGTNTIIEINGSNNQAISPTSNYILEAQYPATATSYTNLLDDSLNVALDPSGNVWVTNYLGNSVVEVVGAAAPVVTPLSVAAGTNQLGHTP